MIILVNLNQKKAMKKIIFFIYLLSIVGYSQTPITDVNFKEVINDCLVTNPIDGMCSEGEYGVMPDWDVSNVTDMSNAFRLKSNFNADISAWVTSNVIYMRHMFNHADNFNQNIGAWDVRKVTNMYKMFASAHAFNQDIGVWNVNNVTTMYRMFANAHAFNQNIGVWDVSKVTTMSEMFDNTSTFNQDISTWDVSKVTDMTHMFRYTTVFSVENYDALLIAWSTLTLQQGVTFSNSDSNLQYCAAKAARQSIIDNYNWTIIDAGEATDCDALSIEDNEGDSLSFLIYPNPTGNYLFIEGNENPVAISIYNVLGKQLISTKNTNKIDVQELPGGVYLIKLSDGVSQTNKKFIKK